LSLLFSSVQSAVWGANENLIHRIFQYLEVNMPFEVQSASESETIAVMKERLSKFETEEGRLKGLSYVPKSPDEVAITTTPKAGTTWLQRGER
jgi:hypothetical protein